MAAKKGDRFSTRRGAKVELVGWTYRGAGGARTRYALLKNLASGRVSKVREDRLEGRDYRVIENAVEEKVVRVPVERKRQREPERPAPNPPPALLPQVQPTSMTATGSYVINPPRRPEAQVPGVSAEGGIVSGLWTDRPNRYIVLGGLAALVLTIVVVAWLWS